MSNTHRIANCVLVIDDDPLTRDLATDLLRSLGVTEVRTATDGASGLAELRRGSVVDLILCDLNMPGMDGVIFMRQIARLLYRGGFAILSGENESLLRSSAELAHAHSLNYLGVVKKPLTSHLLLEVMQQYARTDHQTEVTMQAEPTVPALRSAISNGDLVVHYQPQFEVATGQVVSVEALVRWLHPTAGLIPPNSFINLAERHNLIDAITEFVCRQVLNDYPVLDSLSPGDLGVSINISAQSLQQQLLPDRLARWAEEAGVPSDRLVLEITETQIIEQLSVSLDTLSRLRLKGFHLSIDDFGTGYASLRQLRLIPFDELKVDRSYLQAPESDVSARAIIQASADLARSLSLRTVGEGIEEQRQLDRAREFGLDRVQGFLFCHPLPLAALQSWADTWNPQSIALEAT